MPLLRVVTPPALTARLLDRLEREPTVTNLTVLPGASRKPPGDLLICEVGRSAVDHVLSTLDGHDEGVEASIQQSEPLIITGPAPPDSEDEAVIWRAVTRALGGESRPSVVNVILITLAAAIAAIGIIEDQLLLIVGAMALSPDNYPVFALSLAAVERNRSLASRALRTLALGFGFGAIAAFVLTELIVAIGYQPAAGGPSGQLTLFIARPDALSVLVAVLAGVAGALAVTLTDGRSLVGVFVSVTTIPAAAYIGAALAVSQPRGALGAAIQLVVNVVSLFLAGWATIAIQRWLGRRRPLAAMPAS